MRTRGGVDSCPGRTCGGVHLGPGGTRGGVCRGHDFSVVEKKGKRSGQPSIPQVAATIKNLNCKELFNKKNYFNNLELSRSNSRFAISFLQFHGRLVA